MLRMDLLLNPGTPPPSPMRDPMCHPAVCPPRFEAVVEPKPDLFPTTPSSAVPMASQHPSRSSLLAAPLTPEKPALKRIKRDLPGMRLLLESVDNQRDEALDERPGIFSGHAFWDKVLSLHQSEASSDVSQSERSARGAPHPQSRALGLGERTTVLQLPSSALLASTSEQKPIDNKLTGVENVDEDEPPCDAAESNNGGSKKKKTTICKEEGCKSQSLSKNLCMKHGGGPRCSYPDCNNGAKLRNLCFQHGGSTICLAPSCSSKAKRFGYCWSHGGGRICAEEDCSKVAAQGGMCWAHGGGNRCKLPGCTKRSYKQHDYYCKRHAEVSADY